MLSDSWQQFYDQSYDQSYASGDKSADWGWLRDRVSRGRSVYGGDWERDARLRELLLSQARDRQTLKNASAEFAKLSPKQKVGMEISTLSSLGAYDSGKYGDVSDRYMATQEEISRLENQRLAWKRSQPSAAPQPAKPQPQQAAQAPQQPQQPAQPWRQQPTPPAPAPQPAPRPRPQQQATAYAPAPQATAAQQPAQPQAPAPKQQAAPVQKKPSGTHQSSRYTPPPGQKMPFLSAPPPGQGAAAPIPPKTYAGWKPSKQPY